MLAYNLDVEYINTSDAGLAQLVARNLAKVEVAGSNPVARSIWFIRSINYLIGLFNKAT